MIETVEQLEELEDGSVIRTNTDSVGVRSGEHWVFADNPGLPSTIVVRLKSWQMVGDLPATLLVPAVVTDEMVERSAGAIAEMITGFVRRHEPLSAGRVARAVLEAGVGGAS